MPLVFVHGVNNRRNLGQYEATERRRNALFNKYLVPTIAPAVAVHDFTILSPYWGEFGATPRWNNASLPRSAERLGEPAVDHIRASLGDYEFILPDDPNQTLLSVAREVSFLDAVELVCELLLEELCLEKSTTVKVDDAERSRLDRESDAFVDYCETAVEYFAAVGKPAWLDRITSDEVFLGRLQNDIDAHIAKASPRATEQLGGASVWRFSKRILNGVARVASEAVQIAKTPVDLAFRSTSRLSLSLGRGWAQQHASRFLGDVFEYMEQRNRDGSKAPIIQAILPAFAEAMTIRGPNDRLIILAHSLGALIAYDVMTTFVDATFHCDCFVTIGSQVSLFQELSKCATNAPNPANIEKDRIQRPPNVDCWLNVFDRNDVFGFGTAGVFTDTIDYAYSTGKGFLFAHGSYFQKRRFYKRLAKRLVMVLK